MPQTRSGTDTNHEPDLESSVSNSLDAPPSVGNPQPSRPPSLEGDLKIPLPDPFDGSQPTQLCRFLYHLGLVFRAQPNRFQSDEMKIIFASALLKGPAFDWAFSQNTIQPTPQWMLEYDAFAKELTRLYGVKDQLYDIEQQLRNLRQTGSVTDYTVEFRRLADLLDYTERAQVFQYHQGLKDSIKYEILRSGKPTSLQDYVNTATDIDRNLQELNQARRPNFQAPRKNQHARGHAASRSASHGPAPTEARNPGPSSARPQERKSRPPFQPLTDEQKDYRRKNGLCMYCADPSHDVLNCPVRPSRPRPARGAGATFATARPQGNAPAQWQ
jgi:hypothetical protein